jgi:hypothetical protein
MPGAPPTVSVPAMDDGTVTIVLADDHLVVQRPANAARGRARQRREREAGPRRGPASTPVPGHGNGSGLPDRGTPVRAAAPVGRPRPVPNTTRPEPPAASRNRGEVARWRRAGRFEEDTVAGLAAVMFGERKLESLDDRQARELAVSPEFAVRGQVSEHTLAGALERLSERDDRAEAARALRAWLIQRANEVELLRRRRAA